MEFYENGGSAVARLLWSSPSTPKAVVPATRLYPSATPPATSILINFQPAASPVPAGYLADGGLVYGNRGNGQSYGWTLDNAAQARDRDAANSPDQRYDTLTHLQKPANPDAIWEIALVNGTYRVRIVAGDATNFDSVFRTTAEGVLTVNGTPTTLDALDRGHGDRDGHRRAADDPQRRRRQQQQDLLRGDHAAVRGRPAD